LVAGAASIASTAHADPVVEYKVVVGDRAPTRDRAVQPVPEGFHKERKIDRGLLASAIGTFVIGYGASALTAIPAANQGGAVLLVPFAGPFLMMGNVKQDSPQCDPSTTMCADSRNQVAIDSYLAIMGVAQIVGAGLFVTALIARHDVLVRDAVKVSVHVSPVVTGQFAGVQLTGTF
jgi:hypothetical protein